MPAAGTWLIFDINETCLDLAPVEKIINALTGSEHGFNLFFNRLITSSHVSSFTGAYPGFTTLQKAALKATLESFGKPFSDDDLEKVKAAFGAEVRAHAEVPAALDELRKRGWKLCAFSNSTLAALTLGLERAGIADKYDRILSVEGNRAFKPLHSTYQYAMNEIEAKPADCLMVSCHDWDLAGGMAVGLRSVFIKRPGKTFVSASYSEAFPPPDFTSTTFEPLADVLDGAPDRA